MNGAAQAQSGTRKSSSGPWSATLSASFATNRLSPVILASYRTLAQDCDLVIVEGAGSPAEINLRNGDLANMGFATAAGINAILIGDIHRGGVIATVAGTFQTIGEADRKYLKGFLINNFHGDPQLFSEGVAMTERLSGAPCLGVIPHFAAASRLPAEDSVALSRAMPGGSGRSHRRAAASTPPISTISIPSSWNLASPCTWWRQDTIPHLWSLVIVPGSKSSHRRPGSAPDGRLGH
jgi:adenosylcobyric acid synthase